MRVLYFTRGYTSHDHRFLEALGRTEHEVWFLRLAPDAPATEACPLPPGVREARAWEGDGDRFWRRLPGRVARLRALLADLRPDLVHAGPVPQVAFLAALAGARRLVSMSWGSDLLVEARRLPWRWTARYALARSTVFVCDCQTVRRAAHALGMPDERIVEFPWGVDLEHFSPGEADCLRRDLGIEEGAFVLLSTRAWEPLLGVEVLVEGFLRAAAREPRLHLVLLADGSLRGWVERRVEEAGLEDRVHRVGPVGYADLPRYHRAADLYVSASHSDGSSVSLMEAMACGRPALVSDIPGNREWVVPGVNGWWFRDGDPADLAEKILLAAGFGDLAALGARARRVAEARADWRRNFRRLLEAYDLARALEGGS